MRTKMAIRLCLVAAAVISMNAAAKGETARSTMAPGATLGKGYEISLPDKKWSLVIDLPGFVIFTEEYVPDRQMKKMMAIKGEIHVTIYYSGHEID